MIRTSSPWLTLLVAVAVRLLAWLDWRTWDGAAVAILDPAYHLAWAGHIAGGDLVGGEGTWPAAPGPAYLFALARTLGGEGTAPAAVALIAVDLLAVEGVRRLGRRLGGEGIGLVAGLSAAVSAPLVFHDLALLGVSPAMAGLCFALLGALGPSDERRAPWAALGGGIALGVAVLFRPNLLLLAPFLALVAGWRDRPRPLPGAALLLGLSLALAPGLARNVAVGGEWVPISANAGANLWMAHPPGLRANFPPALEVPNNLAAMTRYFRDGASEAEGRELTPAEADRYWQRQARERMAADPGGVAVRTAGRLALALATFDIQDHHTYTAHRRDRAVLGWLPDFGLLLPGLGLAGAVLGFRRGRRREVVLLAGTVLMVAISIAPFLVVERYRLVSHAAWLPLAAAGAAWLLAERRAGWIPALLGVTLLASVDPFVPRVVLPDPLAFGPVTSATEAAGDREAMEASNLAKAFLRADDPEAAERYLRRALALDPARHDDRANLGALLVRQDRVQDGLAQLATVVHEDPTHVHAALTLCTVQVDVGVPVAALQSCEHAASIAGGWQPRFLLGLARARTGDATGARQALEAARALAPGEPRIRAALGEIAPR